MFRCLLRWDDVYRLKVFSPLFFIFICDFILFAFRLRILNSNLKKTLIVLCCTVARLSCTMLPLIGICLCWFCLLFLTLNFSSYLLAGSSDMNFEKLCADYVGSIVPLCSTHSFNKPGQRVQNYPGALQDLHYVLDLIGQNPKGGLLFLLCRHNL